MIQKLDDSGFVTYERYRGLTLTPKGQRLGKQLYSRYQVLEAFLKFIGLHDAVEFRQTVEGVEHHFSPEAIERIGDLLKYIEEHPKWWQEFASWSDRDSPSWQTHA